MRTDIIAVASFGRWRVLLGSFPWALAEPRKMFKVRRAATSQPHVKANVVFIMIFIFFMEYAQAEKRVTGELILLACGVLHASILRL